MPPVPTAMLVASATSVNFGALDVIDGGTGSVTITNQGQAPSGPMSITATEGITVSGCSGALAAGASCTLTIVVKPDASTGVFTGTVTIAAQPGTLTPLVIAVSAAGSLLLPFTVDPWRIDLGIVQMGIAVPRVEIAVSAKKNLTDLTVTTSGPDVAIDEQNTTCTAVLAVRQTCVVAVKFLATTAGDKKDTVSILGGGRSGVLISVSITATVLPPFTVIPSLIDLGTIQVGVVTAFPQLTVIAKYDLTDLTVTASGPDVTIDEENTTCAAVLASGQTCMVAVKFLATTAGEKKDTVSILGGGRSGEIVSVPITATVVAFSLDGGVDLALDGSTTEPLDGGADVPLDGGVAPPLDGSADTGAAG